MDYSLFLACGCFGIFYMMFKNQMKEKTDEKENPVSVINDLQIKTSMNAMDIHKLYLENIELRNKLHTMYENELQENIKYYRNIVLMNEKIEYMQKYMLNRLHS
jgi:hypothetical protein